MEVCICAAVLTLNGEIICGHRHCHAIKAAIDANLKPEVQGFLTSESRFVDRREGLRLQLEAGIPSKSKNGYLKYHLFSEDLY